MKRTVATILAACGVVSLAFAATLGTWQSLQDSRYEIFCGDTMPYGEASTTMDRKLSIVIKGLAAKEIFDSIGPDARETCSSGKGDRERNKGAVQYMYTAKAVNGAGKGYRCWIGVNLINGQGIPKVSC